MAWGFVKALFGKGSDSGIGGAAQGIGKGISGVAKVWKVGADANDQRVFDSYASARAYVPQGWLGKQIRPWVTIVTLIPQLLLAINLGWQIYIHMKTGDNVEGITMAVGLFSGMGALYYAYTGTIMTFWFGGQAQKYGIAHQQSKADAERAHMRAHTLATHAPTANDATAGNTAPTDPRKPALDPDIQAWNDEVSEDFFTRQARDR